VTPFGSGSSVCGGVEPKRNDHKGAVTIDLRQMDRVKEVENLLYGGGALGGACLFTL
jgi:alkyldihydroxyacetonephosphate synthase